MCGRGRTDARAAPAPERPIEVRLQLIRRRLDARGDVEAYVVGALVDLWHGPFDELDAVVERRPER
jgi:hypothetical protein